MICSITLLADIERMLSFTNVNVSRVPSRTSTSDGAGANEYVVNTRRYILQSVAVDVAWHSYTCKNSKNSLKDLI